MTQLIPVQVDFANGWYPSQPAYGGLIPRTAYLAPNMWKDGAVWSPDKGTTSVGSSGSPVYLQIVDGQTAGMTTNGNVASMFSTLWFAGTGNAVRNGSVIGAGTGFLMLIVSSVAVQAGLSQPSAPTFAPTATSSTKFNGVYAVGLVAVRQTSGAISNVSLRSAVISVKNLKGRITFPSAPTGATHWLIYGTAKGQGTVGVLRKVTTIAPVAVGTATLDVDWVDGELGDLAPITNDPPPACTHCFPIGGIMCVVSSSGHVYPSKVNQPEAYDITQAVRLASGEPVVGITARGSDGGVFVGTRNSISLIVATGSELAPILPRGVFENIGIAHGNAMAWVYDTLYVWSSKGTLCRTHGGNEPDTSFTAPVKKYFKDRNAADGSFGPSNTVLVHDIANGAVLVCSGSIAVPFNLSTEDWSGPITLPGSSRAGIGMTSSGLVDIGGTLYTLNSGSAPAATAFLQTPRLSCGPSGYSKKWRSFRGAAIGTCTMDILGEGGSTIGGPFPYTFTAPHGTWLNGIINGIHSASFKISTSVAAMEPQEIVAEFSYEGAHVG